MSKSQRSYESYEKLGTDANNVNKMKSYENVYIIVFISSALLCQV